MTPQLTTVSILQHAACGACHAAGLCGLAGLAEKTVEVATDPYASYGVGDEVEVMLKASMGMKAVYLAYLIPLLLLVAVILGLSALGVGELPAAFSAVGALAVYYLLLFLFSSRLKNEYVFTIKR